MADYDNTWPAKYETHQSIIRAALGNVALDVHHIGSTSVPGLAAKPVIDIMVAVADSSDEQSYVPALEAAGYVLRIREPEFDEHRMLWTSEQDMHLHVWSQGSVEISRHLKFRDRLRQNETDRQLYENVKRALAAQNFEDRNAYTEGKNDVIADIECRS